MTETVAREAHLEALREKSPALRKLAELEELDKKVTGELTRGEVSEIYGKTIKNDVANIEVLFYGLINNFSESDQSNFGVTGPSCTGKSYLPREILRPFPEENIHWKGYNSPKSFYYEKGELVGEDGSPLSDRRTYINERIQDWIKDNPKPEAGDGVTYWNEERRNRVAELKQEYEDLEKYIVVDLHQQILVFLDTNSDALLQELRPVLSHDKKEIEVSIVNRSKDGKNRIMKVIIRGYPTMITSSVSHMLDEQEQTRHIQISPETTQDKYVKSLKVQTEALANPRKYREEVREDDGINLLRRRIQLIRDSQVSQAIVPKHLAEEIYERFIENHPTLRPRHQRDYPRIIQYIKAHALFNQWTREKSGDGCSVYVNRLDVEEGFNILEPLLESNELGIPPYEYKFFKESLKPALLKNEGEGLHRNDIGSIYYKHHKTMIGQNRRDKMIQLYLETGLVYEATNPNDRRMKNIYLTPPVGKNFKNTETMDQEDSKINTHPGLGIYSQTGTEGSESLSPVLQERLEDLTKHMSGSEDVTVPELSDVSEIQPEGVESLLGVLERDNMVFQPRPGYWRLTQ